MQARPGHCSYESRNEISTRILHIQVLSTLTHVQYTVLGTLSHEATLSPVNLELEQRPGDSVEPQAFPCGRLLADNAQSQELKDLLPFQLASEVAAIATTRMGGVLMATHFRSVTTQILNDDDPGSAIRRPDDTLRLSQ